MKAAEYYNSGYSCSESIIMEAIDKGLVPKELLAVSTAFSRGMGSGCLCGAISGSQIVLGYLFGRNNAAGNEVIAREKAKEFVEEFKQRHKATCCRVLTSSIDKTAPDAMIQIKKHCTNMVDDCSRILDEMVKIKANN